MAKPEWGVKRICSACGTKYYDFNNSPITVSLHVMSNLTLILI